MKKRATRACIQNKTAQANLIVIILVILISIVAVLILSNILLPLIREKSKEAEERGEALALNFEIKEVLLFVTGASKVTLTRGAGEGRLDSLKFVFYDENQNSYVETRNSDIKELETRTYSFPPPQNLGKIKSVSVLPVFGKATGMSFESKPKQILEIPNGLVSWWKFDGSADDFIGNNNCGSADIIEDSERQKAASFSGSGGAINCGNNSELSIDSKFAISFWVKTSSNGGIAKKGNNYEISLDSGKVNFSYADGALKSGASDSAITNGKWHHITLSRDWHGDEYLRIYIDGTLDKLNSLPEIPEINSENLLIGESFNGAIDDLMFFNEPLSMQAVEALYNNQKR